MTRPRKTTVDWFPHSVNHGRTMFTLEKRYGLAGYCFWFKLLEVLGNTEGHFIDTMDPASLEFLAAYTYTEKEKCTEILSLLAKLDAIDPKLWKEQVVWSDNFVRGLAPVYRNREHKLPGRPDNYRKESGSSGVSDADNPPRKEGKEGKEGKEKEKKATSPPETGSEIALIPSFAFSCRHFDVESEYFQKLIEDYPGLDNGRLLAEIKKAADYCSDNPRKHSRDSRGKLVNKRLYLRNWMERATVVGQRGPPMSKAEQVTQANLRAAKEVMKKYE